VKFIAQSKFLMLILSVCLLASCANQKYQAKPLDPTQTSAKLLNKDASSGGFQQYLIKQGYPASQLPFADWGLDELTLCALYYHTKLDVAKTQLALANGAVLSAGQKPTPTLNGNFAHSNQKNGDLRPWAYGLNVEIPIETGNKRQLRVEEAQNLAEAARMDVAETAWQLRSQIANDLIAYHENQANKRLLGEELAIQNSIIAMLQARLAQGLISSTDLHAAQLLQQKTQFNVNAELAKTPELRSKLAADVGLSAEKFAAFKLKPLAIESTIQQQSALLDAPAKAIELQQSALLNRIDIRRSLAKYAAAESKIKLEVAKQTPDISLTPGLAFEFGDSIWSLGFSSLLQLLNKNNNSNQLLIAEATQLREVEGAQFEALQAQIIADLSQSYARITASEENLKQANAGYNAQLTQMGKLQKQHNAGLIDRLQLTQTSLYNVMSQQQVASAQFAVLKASAAIEDLIQRPLFINNNQ
jgi:outer membrane protein, heavy metal efflux system